MEKRIVIKGAYGDANFGDDALMCTIENFFVSEDLGLNTVFCGTTSDYCGRLLQKSGYIDISKNKMPAADVLIYGGGTQFFLFDSNKGSFYLKFFLKLLKSDPKLLLLKVKTKISGKRTVPAEKYVGLGLGLGPFNPENNRIEYIKSLVRQMDLLFVRDPTSLSYCKDWGCHDADEGADVCFSRFMNYDKPVRINGADLHIGPKRRKIGVIVRDWKYENGGNGYQKVLLKMIDELKNSDYEFTFIVFSVRDSNWKKLLDEGMYPYVEWDPSTGQIAGFMDTLDGFDGFITARYHGGVFASVLNKPAVCIGIEPKLSILAEQIKGFTLWDSPFSEDDLKQAMKVFDNENFDCSDSVNMLREKADAMFESLRTYLCDLQ